MTDEEAQTSSRKGSESGGWNAQCGDPVSESAASLCGDRAEADLRASLGSGHRASLCHVTATSTGRQVSYTSSQPTGTEIRSVVPRGGGQGGCGTRRGAGRRSPRGTMPSYKINEPQGCKPQHGKYNSHAVCRLWPLLGERLPGAIARKRRFSASFAVCLSGRGHCTCCHDRLMTSGSHVARLPTLDSPRAVCQPPLPKTGRK